jgi:hypothetical protein
MAVPLSLSSIPDPQDGRKGTLGEARPSFLIRVVVLNRATELKGCSICRIGGSTTPLDPREQMNKFQQGGNSRDAPKLFLLSTRAGGGLVGIKQRLIRRSFMIKTGTRRWISKLRTEHIVSVRRFLY